VPWTWSETIPLSKCRTRVFGPTATLMHGFYKGRNHPRQRNRWRVVFRAVLPGRLPRRHAVASPDPAGVGFVVAAVFGIVSLKIVVWTLYRAQLKIFTFYVCQP